MKRQTMLMNIFSQLLIGFCYCQQLFAGKEKESDGRFSYLQNIPAHHIKKSFRGDGLSLLHQNESTHQGVRGSLQTPLHLAVKRGDARSVELLLRSHADVNAKDHHQRTPLDLTLKTFKPELIKILLTQASDDQIDEIPYLNELTKAILKNDTHALKKALLNALDPNRSGKNKFQWTPLCLASALGRLEAVQLLLNQKGIVINLENSYQWFPLDLAIQAGYPRVVSCLLDKDFKIIHRKNKAGLAPLSVAIEKFKPRIINILLKKILDSNVENIDYLTPMHLAILENDTLSLKKILKKKGTNPNDSEGKIAWTPLCLASWLGHLDSVRLLIKYRANINQKSSNGHYPLYLAIWKNHVEIVDFLLFRNADFNLKVLDHRLVADTALVLAIRNHNLDIIDLFLHCLKHSSAEPLDLSNSLTLAIFKNDQDFLRNIPYRDPALNQCDETISWTPLCLALALKRFDIAKLLLAKGVEVNTIDSFGFYPLYLAFDYQQLDIAKLILQKNANVHVSTIKGYDLIFLAVECGDPDLVRMMLEKGADPNAVDCAGLSILEFARMHSKPEIVQLLEERMELKE